MNMKPNPESWRLPIDLPPVFALPQEFRQSLQVEAQEWLNGIEKRIDGLTLDRIQEEAEEEAEGDSVARDTLYLLGRRLFYTRMQQIVELMFPEHDVEVGNDLLWEQTTNELPGAAVTNAVINGNGYNTDCLKRLKQAGFSMVGSSLM